MTATLIDPYNRHLNYLRLSITDRCNLRCLYCTPDGRLPKLTHDQVLSYEEILHLARIAVSLGIRKIRVTGGEPLARKNAVRFIGHLAQIDGLEDISLTTNGILLARYLDPLKRIGVRRFNISLDSLKPERFKNITGYDHFKTVWNTILKAHEMGFSPIKINTVVLKGINDDELLDFARLSKTYPFHIRFIEYMPIGISQVDTGQHLLTPEIKDRLAGLGPLEPIDRKVIDGPAQRFRLAGAAGEIGFISALSCHFCRSCNRLRLTASGQLRTCLLADRQTDLRTPLRNGATDGRLAAIIREAVRHKQQGHRLNQPRHPGVNSQMSDIGG